MGERRHGDDATTVVRWAADADRLRTTDASPATALRELLGADLRAVAERAGGEWAISYCRDDADPDVRADPDVNADSGGGVRTTHDCTVTVRDGAVRLLFDRPGGRVLVVADARPSRSLARLVADCRAALARAD